MRRSLYTQIRLSEKDEKVTDPWKTAQSRYQKLVKLYGPERAQAILRGKLYHAKQAGGAGSGERTQAVWRQVAQRETEKSSKRKKLGKYAAGTAAAAGAAYGGYKLAQRLKKRKECKARFPNDSEKYKACLKS
jgi:hypothetical protein